MTIQPYLTVDVYEEGFRSLGRTIRVPLADSRRNRDLIRWISNPQTCPGVEDAHQQMLDTGDISHPIVAEFPLLGQESPEVWEELTHYYPLERDPYLARSLSYYPEGGHLFLAAATPYMVNVRPLGHPDAVAVEIVSGQPRYLYRQVGDPWQGSPWTPPEASNPEVWMPDPDSIHSVLFRSMYPVLGSLNHKAFVAYRWQALVLPLRVIASSWLKHVYKVWPYHKLLRPGTDHGIHNVIPLYLDYLAVYSLFAAVEWRYQLNHRSHCPSLAAYRMDRDAVVDVSHVYDGRYIPGALLDGLLSESAVRELYEQATTFFARVLYAVFTPNLLDTVDWIEDRATDLNRGDCDNPLWAQLSHQWNNLLLTRTLLNTVHGLKNICALRSAIVNTWEPSAHLPVSATPESMQLATEEWAAIAMSTHMGRATSPAIDGGGDHREGCYGALARSGGDPLVGRPRLGALTDL